MSKKYLQITKKLFRILLTNPAFFFKRIFLELKYLILPVPKSSAVKKINGVAFEFNFNSSPKVKRMYFNSYQPAIAEVLKKYLKKGDTFIDVGANIGYFSALAAGLVGKIGQIHSFEPVPEYFTKLDNLAKMNSQYKITANQFALGDEEKYSTIYIKGGPDIGNNTFSPVLLEDAKNGQNKTVEVSIRRLDAYIKEKRLNNIKLIKIDVEGFEFPVLRGLSNYFAECSQANSCPLIICEIVPGIYLQSSQTLDSLFDYMRRFSYHPFDIINNKKRIDIKKIGKRQLTDVIFRVCK